MSSFRSRSPPLCFERVGSPSETADVTDLTQSNSSLDFDPCWSSSTSIKFDYNSLLKDNITKQVATKEVKETVTGSTVDVGQISSVVKRLSTAELELMIQSQLGKVIDGHRYTTWLRKQVDESDAQMAKYKNRIEVNDLSAVIQKHIQSSEESYSPPRKLTRNVGLQVRIKEKGSELCQGSVGELPIDHNKQIPTAQDISDSSIKLNENQNSCLKLDDVIQRKESNQTPLSLRSIEIDLTHSDGDESPRNKSPEMSASHVQVTSYLGSSDMPIVADCIPDSEKSGDLSSGLPGLCTPPSFIPPMDVTSKSNNRIIPTLRPCSQIIPSVEPPCLENMSPSTSDSSIGTCPTTNNPSIGFVRVQAPPEHRTVPPPLIPSYECHPSAGPSCSAYPKNSTNGTYSNVDRKRRLPCSITSIDASTVASVEKYNKLIKERWYDSHQPPAEMPTSALSRPKCMSQSEVQNHPSMTGPVSHQPVQNLCQNVNKTRLPIIPKPIHQREFAKRVESIGMYHKWKLPIPPYISISSGTQPIRQSVIFQSTKQQQQPQNIQISNIRTWIPRSNCLDTISSPAKQCAADVEDTQQLPNPLGQIGRPIHQQSEYQHSSDCHPAQSSSNPHGSKKVIPDLIAISKEDSVSPVVSPCLPSSPLVNEWKNNNLIITNFKPILMLTRSLGGIRVEWTIPNLTRSQQVSQIESYVLYARKEKGLAPSSDISWLRVAVFSALPLPMSYVFKELTPGYRYYFRIAANFRERSGDVRTHEIPFSEPASMMM